MQDLAVFKLSVLAFKIVSFVNRTADAKLTVLILFQDVFALREKAVQTKVNAYVLNSTENVTQIDANHANPTSINTNKSCKT